MKFGDFLLNQKLVSKESLQEALDLQRYKKQSIGRILRDLGQIDQHTLNRSLFLHLKPECNLKIEELKETIKKHQEGRENHFPLKNKRALLLDESENAFVLLSDTFQDEVLEACERRSGKAGKFVTVKTEIFEYLQKSFGVSHAAKSSLVLVRELTDDEKLSENDPYAMLFRECLEAAVKRGASDIHIEPKEEGILLRLRVHGDLDLWKHLEKSHQLPLISKIKQIVNLDLAKVGEPQDGRAAFDSFKVDVRANSVPLVYGDKIVLRLLNHDRSFDLEKSAMEVSALSALKDVVSKRDGLILISGPTGSGKTTTLYSLMNYLESHRLNVSTIENPVEYRLPGINQIDIGSNHALNFSNSLRALMRQDPDVILVGEIRDRETAELCFQASATGHLVLSTLHANGAFEVIERLINLGVNPFSIKSNLRFSASQRLVKKICTQCSRELSTQEMKSLSQQLKHLELSNETQNFRERNKVGCKHCEKGISGRIPILEFMDKPAIQKTLNDEKNLIPSISVSLAKAALHLAMNGDIEIQEVLEMI